MTKTKSLLSSTLTRWEWDEERGSGQDLGAALSRMAGVLERYREMVRQLRWQKEQYRIKGQLEKKKRH